MSQRIVAFALISLFIVGYGCSTDIGHIENQPEGYDSIEYLDVLVAYKDISFQAINERAHIVVKGFVVDDVEYIKTCSHPAKNETDCCPRWPVGSLVIQNVIKGDANIGGTIRIAEPYIVKDRVLYAYSNYLPSRPGQEYIFFLKKPNTELEQVGELGIYPVDNGDRGRYPVPAENRRRAHEYSREELSLGEQSIDVYLNIYQEVIDAYIN